jgi:hypothetical protein
MTVKMQRWIFPMCVSLFAVLFVLFFLYLASDDLLSGCVDGEVKSGLKVRCEKNNHVVRDVNDGFLAGIQGHGRVSAGSISYGDAGFDVNMQGHFIDTTCCFGRGVIVDGRSQSYLTKAYDVVIRNGYFISEYGVFALGVTYIPMSFGYNSSTASSGCDVYDHGVNVRNLWLREMVLVGGSGSIVSDFSGLESSRLKMRGVVMSGNNSRFGYNKYIHDAYAGSYFPLRSVKKVDDLKSIYTDNLQSMEKFDTFSPLLLSCADNAIVSDNTFTAKTKTPGAYAIILKHSKNVRITNNTFEGFTVPILMDKYSSIIDDSGNIIKPDITADSPESKLYGP